MKKLLPFFLLLSFFLTPTFASASAVTREMALVDQARNSTANTSFNDVRVLNGTVSGNVSQRAIAGGSAGTISQPISMPASAGAAARSAAGLAGRMAGGFAAAAAAGWAVQKLLDGVGWIMKDGSVVQKNDQSSIPTTWDKQGWSGFVRNSSGQFYYFSTYQAALANFPPPSSYVSWSYYNVASTSACIQYLNKYGSQVATACTAYTNNPNYSSTSSPPPPTYTAKTPQQVQDAFYNWLVNNPTSVTDPVYQSMYTPAQTTGWNLTGEEGAHYGNDGITDEMVNDILNARNAALTGSKTYTLNDSVIPNVDGTSTETTTNPDGSKKTTNTSVTTDKGKRTTTAIETTTNPDGTQSTKTTTKTEDVPQTYPAACEWFATACDWFGWTQKDDLPQQDDQDDQVQQEDNLPKLATDTFSFSGACPPPYVMTVPSLVGGSNTLTYSFDTFCTWLVKLHPWVRVCGWITALCILTGYRSNSSE